jgi:hypothetical protein
MGILDAIAGGLSGGAGAGNSIADQQMQQAQRMALTQQTSDLQVAAEKQISDYKMQQTHAEQARVGAIISGATRQVPAPIGTNPDGSEAAGPPEAGAPTVAKFDPGLAVQRLNQAGMTGAASELAKQNEFAVGGAAWGKQVLYNRITGDIKSTIDEPGQTHLAAAGAGRQAAIEAAQEKLYGMLDKSPIGLWSTTGPDGKSQPHPAASDAYRSLAEGYVGSGMNPSLAMSRSRLELSEDGTKLDAALAQKGYKPGTPEFEQQRTVGIMQAVRSRLGGGQAPPAPAPSTQTPGIVSGAMGPPAPAPAAPKGPLGNLKPGAAAAGAGSGARAIQALIDTARRQNKGPTDTTPTGP